MNKEYYLESEEEKIELTLMLITTEEGKVTKGMFTSTEGGKGNEQGSGKQEGLGSEGSSKQEGLGSEGGTRRRLGSATDPILNSLIADSVKEETAGHNKAVFAWADVLKKLNEMPIEDLKTSDGAEEFILSVLRKQSNVFTRYLKIRMIWVDSMRVNLPEDSKVKLQISRVKLVEIQQNYWAKLVRIIKLEDKAIQCREFYATLNQYRNEVLKELNKCDTVVMDDLRKSYFYNNKGLKKVLNVENTQAKKEFHHQDGYLRAKIGELLKARRNR